MGLSNSTLHWLEDGEQAVPGPADRAGHDAELRSRARRSPGRKRAVLVVGGAGADRADRRRLLLRAGAEAAAPRRRPRPSVGRARPRPDDARRGRAGREPIDEALELAHLALVADPRFADAHFVVGDGAAGRATRPPKRATSFASTSSWRRWGRTPQAARTALAIAAAMTATRPPSTRRLPLADLRARYVDGGRAAAGVDRGGAGRRRPRRARARSSRRWRAAAAPTVPRGSGCARCCATRPRCGAAASRTSPASTRPG